MDREQAISSSADATVNRFAERLQQEFGATAVYLRLPMDCEEDTDYEFTVVSPRFRGDWSPYRGNPLGERWYQLGGAHPVRILCLTPKEFEQYRSRTAVAQALQGAERIV